MLEILWKGIGLSLLLGSPAHLPELFDKAVLRNGKIIVQAGSHGRWLGELRVAVGAAGAAIDDDTSLGGRSATVIRLTSSARPLVRRRSPAP
jgi:2',3'-cyclic-nucleotide 2'-phosphodiesterase (5'-nucleotidase family)